MIPHDDFFSMLYGKLAIFIPILPSYYYPICLAPSRPDHSDEFTKVNTVDSHGGSSYLLNPGYHTNFPCEEFRPKYNV
jgi:hypothetical protein